MLKNSTQPAGGGNVMYPGKVPGKVKYTFAFGALGKDMIYGMIATFSMIYLTDIIKVAPAFIVLCRKNLGRLQRPVYGNAGGQHQKPFRKVCPVAGSRNTD